MEAASGLIELHLVGVDPFVAERVRLAVATNPLFRIIHTAPADLAAVPPNAIAIVSHEAIGTAVPAHHRIPVLCYGPALLLEAAEPGWVDEYLAEPWSDAELRYRLRRLAGTRTVRCPGGLLHIGPGWISVAGTRLALPSSQYAILDLLVRSCGTAVPRAALLALLSQRQGGSRALDMQVSRLRSRLAEACRTWTVRPEIRAVRGKGYRFSSG